MARRGHTPEQVITKPREAAVALAQGQSVARVCGALEVTGQTLQALGRGSGGIPVAESQQPR